MSGPPPPLSSEAKSAVAEAATSSATGSHVPGQDDGTKVEGEKKVKSEKELERERKKAEKQAKFDQKKAKVAPAATSKNKEKKAKAAEKAEEDILPAYVEDTPFGEKKSEFNEECCYGAEMVRVLILSFTCSYQVL